MLAGTVALCDVRAALKYELGAAGQIASASSSKITPSLQRLGNLSGGMAGEGMRGVMVAIGACGAGDSSRGAL